MYCFSSHLHQISYCASPFPVLLRVEVLLPSSLCSFAEHRRSRERQQRPARNDSPSKLPLKRFSATVNQQATHAEIVAITLYHCNQRSLGGAIFKLWKRHVQKSVKKGFSVLAQPSTNRSQKRPALDLVSCPSSQMLLMEFAIVISKW